MPKKESQKVKGCKKCGRTKRKGTKTTSLSLFVRNRISAVEYFKQTDQKIKK